MTDLSITKHCRTCNADKPLNDFYKNKSKPDGLCSNCKLCTSAYSRSDKGKASRDRFYAKHQVRRRQAASDWDHANPGKIKAWKLRKRCAKFGITTERYFALISAQEGRCAICRIDFSTRKYAPAIDHCHKSGKVRGLLCLNCNSGIGKLREDVQILQKAIAYIESHS